MLAAIGADGIGVDENILRPVESIGRSTLPHRKTRSHARHIKADLMSLSMPVSSRCRTRAF
jgi:hypothetical protein